MSTSFKILISISKNDDGSQLFFKMDGERFKYPKTVKFNAETVYKITIRVQPHENISNVSLSGVNVDGQSTKEESSSSFSGVWSSGNIQKTKNNARTVIPLKIQFENGSSVQMSLQCKFYPLNENAHNVWGTPLKNIEVKCSHKKN